MSSMLVESGKNGKYYLSVDFLDSEKDYIGTPDEIQERMDACLEIYNRLKTEVKNSLEYHTKGV